MADGNAHVLENVDELCKSGIFVAKTRPIGGFVFYQICSAFVAF
jgi:hypothetical protein